jgi:hypothetical protein
MPATGRFAPKTAVPTFFEGLFFFASWLGLPKPWCPST